MGQWIGAYFKESGIPKTGLSPTLMGYDLSDNSVVLNAVAMTETGSGGYKYWFTNYDNTKNYYFLADSVTLTGEERYAPGWSLSIGNIAAIHSKLPSKSYLSGSADSDGGIDDTEAAVINAQTDTALSDYDAPTRSELTSDKNEIITQVNANETKIDAIASNVTQIKKIEEGRWKIDTSLNQLIIYDDDDTTPLLTFDLKDANGSATSTSPYERTPA